MGRSTLAAWPAAGLVRRRVEFIVHHICFLAYFRLRPHTGERHRASKAMLLKMLSNTFKFPRFNQ